MSNVKLDFQKQCRLMDLPNPTPEYQFDSVRKWRIDWAWPNYFLAVEIEGGFFGVGKHECPICGRRKVAGHTSIQRLKTDLEKYNQLTLNGWALLRFTPEQAESGEAIRIIKTWFESSYRRYL